MLMLGAFTFNFCSRTTDDKTGASSKIVFNVLRTEKGDKIITNTEVLLELETNDHIATLLGDMEENDPVKETLVNVIPKELLTSFKTHFWGDVCYESFVQQVLICFNCSMFVLLRRG